MKVGRLSIIVVLVAALVGAWVIDADHERPEPDDVAEIPLEAQGLMPVAAPSEAISSAWYCAAAHQEGLSESVIIMANASEVDISGTVTLYPGVDEAVVEPVEVGAGATARLEVTDVVDAPLVAALVEFNGGDVVVERRVTGADGFDVAPCVTQAAETWFFAEGGTTRDRIEQLVFFNPFPDPAVIDVTFRTDRDIRVPGEFEGYVVPARSVVIENVGEYVTRREHVSAAVVSRSGRLVVDRLQTVNGSEGVRGLNLSAGAPHPAPAWYFPDGVVAQGIAESYVIYNPGSESAEVDLIVESDDLEGIGEIEPFQLTIPPEGYEEIAVHEEERIGTALADAGENVLRHGASVVSANGVPVVAERVLTGDASTDRTGFDIVLGAPLLGEELVHAASGPEGASTIVVQNPSGDEPALVSIVALDDGERVESPEATDLEVPRAGRLVVDPESLGLPFGRPLVVVADRPVVSERRLVGADPADVSGAVAVPLAGSVSLPETAFG